jgi:hypothetical protein
MKVFPYIMCCFLGTQIAAAQETERPVPPRKVLEGDTLLRRGKDGSERRIVIDFGKDARKTHVDDTVTTRTAEKKSGKPIYGITFSRVDLGLAKIVDNGSFTLSDGNRFLKNRPWKTYNFGFDLLQAGYRFNRHFRVYLSGGFDWTYIRLREDIEFLRNTAPLQYRYTGIDYDKNRLTSSYLRIPLTFEHRFANRRIRLAYGPTGDFLLGGSQRFKSDEEGKRKVKDDYNFSQFRYGAFLRWGYAGFGLYAKYYFSDIFENSPSQAGVKHMSFGLMWGF